MKAISGILMVFLLVCSCKKSVVEKPENLISETKMTEIIYDLSVLEAIKSQKPVDLQMHHINASTYIFQKYKIDSLQFAKSNQYYATDIERYKRMYDRVSKKLDENKTKIDSAIIKKGGTVPTANPELPQVK